MTIIQGIERPDGWEWEELAPAARLQRARELFARKIPLVEHQKTKRTARENREAEARALPHEKGAVYHGRCTWSGSKYFEIRDDTGQTTVHLREWIAGQWHDYRPLEHDDVTIVYTSWPNARVSPRKRCLGCLDNWQETGTYCHACTRMCRWCDNTATSEIVGRPACAACKETLGPRIPLLRNLNFRNSDNDCVVCRERRVTRMVDTHIGLAGYVNHVRICGNNECMLTAVQQWNLNGRDRTQPREILLRGLCGDCHHADIETFIFDHIGNARYACRTCAKRGGPRWMRIPVIRLAGNLIRYDGAADVQ